MARNGTPGAVIAVIALFACASIAAAVTQDFGGYPAGTVAAGTLPDGGTVSSDLFSDFTLHVTNYGGGPNSLVLFDSSSPTGGDWDLGTPNQDFGGPGIGSGGESGEPGENSTPLGNLLIIAEDIADGDGDNVVDDPDDEAGGGKMQFAFHEPTIVYQAKVVDIDDGESAEFTFYNGTSLVGTASAQQYGNNSVQTVVVPEQFVVTRMEVAFSSSGALAEIEYRVVTSATESSSWGAIKNKFR